MDKKTEKIPFEPRFADGRGEIIREKKRPEMPEPAVQAPEPEELTEEKPKKKGGKLKAIIIALLVMVAAAEGAEAVGLDMVALLPERISQYFVSEEPDAEPASVQEAETEDADLAEEAEIGEDEVIPEEEETEAVQLAEHLEVTEFDINYSQQDKSFRSGGVHVLMKVRNDSDVALRKVTFTVQDAEITGSFEAYGRVEPGRTGFMHAHIHIPDDAPKKQGEICIDEAEKAPEEAGPEEAAPQVKGEVSAFHRETDTYDVKVTNTGSAPISSEGAYVVAVKKGYSHLRDSWGAGPLGTDLTPGKEVILKDAIYNPGFDSYETSEYEVFVIRRNM